MNTLYNQALAIQSQAVQNIKAFAEQYHNYIFYGQDAAYDTEIQELNPSFMDEAIKLTVNTGQSRFDEAYLTGIKTSKHSIYIEVINEYGEQSDVELLDFDLAEICLISDFVNRPNIHPLS